jgi:hypothetical protein
LHWVLVGTGAVAATFVSTVVLSVMLAFGPKPDRADSLSALIESPKPSAGMLFLWATPVGSDRDFLVPVNDGGPAVSSAVFAFATRVADRSTSEAALVDALQEAVTERGQTLALQRMNPERRVYTEALLEEISRFRTTGPMPLGATLAVREVVLLASASVTVKGL